MLSPLIVAHKERASSLQRLAGRLIIRHIDLLRVDGPPQPFDKDGIACPSPPVHTHLHSRCYQPSRAVETGTLGPLTTGEDGRSSHHQSVLQRFQTKVHVHRDRHRPRQPIPTAPIHHGNQVPPPPGAAYTSGPSSRRGAPA